MLQSLSWQTLPDRNLKRVKKVRVPSDDYLFPIFFGVVTSYMAKNQLTSFHDALSKLFADTEAHYKSKGRIEGKYFHTLVIEKCLSKARLYNTIFNKSHSIQEEEELKAGAKKYKSESDGK